MLLAISDLVWQALIAAVVTLALAYMQQRNKNAIDKGTAKATVSADNAAEKADRVANTLSSVAAVNTVHAAEMAARVEDVKTALDATTTATTEKLDTIHTLVNSRMAIQLKVAAVALRQVAELTVGQSRHKADVAAAEMAESLLAEHESKQRTVDAREKP